MAEAKIVDRICDINLQLTKEEAKFLLKVIEDSRPVGGPRNTYQLLNTIIIALEGVLK